MTEAFTFPRLGDWEAALTAYVEACRERPYAWGEHDCALFCANAVHAMTGHDPAAGFRGHYSTAIGSERVLRRRGEGSLEAQLDALFAPVEPAFARRGDLVWHDGAVGLAMGPFALFVGQVGEDETTALHGLVRVARAHWQKAWAIGVLVS